MRVSNQLPPSLLHAMLKTQNLRSLEPFTSPAALEGASGRAIGLSQQASTLARAGDGDALPGLRLGVRVNQPRLFELLQARADRRLPAAFDLPSEPAPPAPPVEVAQTSPDAAQQATTTAQEAPTPAAQGAAPASTSEQAPTRFGRADLVGLLREFGDKSEGRSEPLQYDLDGDGKVGPGDLLAMLANLDASAPDSDELSSLLRAYGAREGEERFDASMDHDSDGVIGPSDLLATLAGGDTADDLEEAAEQQAQGHEAEASTTPAEDAPADEPEQARTFTRADIDNLLAEYGQNAEGRSAPLQYDLDGDGVTGPSDLLAALAAFEGGQAQPQTAIESVQSLYGAKVGEERFNPTFDYDNNGSIGPSDLLRALADVGSVVG